MSRTHRLELSAALSETVRTQPILEGRVQPEGITLRTTAVHPSEMFWRQLHFGDFDVSEMSLSSLLIATARGDDRWVALPVFTMRRFFQTEIRVRVDRGIRTPQDLVGKRVGVPEYQQTAAVWARGILEHEFGVRARDIEWFMERGPDRSHGSATGFAPPPGVRLHQIPPGDDIGQMLLRGDLDATLLYLNDRNLVDRSRVELGAEPVIRRLFDPLAEGRRYFAKTGLYPINHTVVVRRALVERHPWIVLNLYSAFLAAKDEARRRAQDVLAGYVETGLLPSGLPEQEPLAYGIKAARAELETIAGYVHEQGLTNRRLQIEEIFARQVLEV
jgi:4,5-dihydroxyphthalate decarboxylase